MRIDRINILIGILMAVVVGVGAVVPYFIEHSIGADTAGPYDPTIQPIGLLGFCITCGIILLIMHVWYRKEGKYES